MAQIVDPEIGHGAATPELEPPGIDVERRLAVSRREDIGTALAPGLGFEHFPRLPIEPDRLGSGLAVGEGEVRRPDPVPLQVPDLADARAGIEQHPDDRDLGRALRLCLAQRRPEAAIFERR